MSQGSCLAGSRCPDGDDRRGGRLAPARPTVGTCLSDLPSGARSAASAQGLLADRATGRGWLVYAFRRVRSGPGPISQLTSLPRTSRAPLIASEVCQTTSQLFEAATASLQFTKVS